MIFYESSRGENVIFSYLDDLQKHESAKVVRALKGLDKDKTNSRKALYTKPLRMPVIELKVGAFRVFYKYMDDDVYILHITRKTTGRTEQLDIDIALSRSQE